ncbi:hypothetical protein E2C01_032627 [Portunus trituberculatus]|uniref:Uncharacterized protein n=1 Tax=Portunus trituberculatus TaxID=210409 RepID=A0A5B7F174_PORTR|nr:hypothetical protein [Portunus trituberculatus]
MLKLSIDLTLTTYLLSPSNQEQGAPEHHVGDRHHHEHFDSLHALTLHTVDVAVDLPVLTRLRVCWERCGGQRS